MNEERKRNTGYEPPRVEVIEVQIEKGFAMSVGVGGVNVGGWNGNHIGGGEANEVI